MFYLNNDTQFENINSIKNDKILDCCIFMGNIYCLSLKRNVVKLYPQLENEKLVALEESLNLSPRCFILSASVENSASIARYLELDNLVRIYYLLFSYLFKFNKKIHLI